MATAEPRRVARSEFPEVVRIELLEGDMDRIDRKLEDIKRMMTAVLMSAASATVVGAINLAYKAL